MSQGHECFGIGRNPMKATPFSMDIEAQGYKYFAYHLTHEMDEALQVIYDEHPKVLISFAAQGEGAASFDRSSWRFYETNSVTLPRLIEELPPHLRFIHVGSSEVYGSNLSPVTETHSLNPTSPYSISKAAFDQHLMVMKDRLRIRFNIIRPSNAYAPGQQLHRIIPRTLICGMTGKKLQLQGGGVARKSFLYGDDLASAIMTVIEKGEEGEIYNAGPDEPTSIRRVVELCAQVLGKNPADLYDIVPARFGEDSCYFLDSTKLRSLGWSPQTTLMGGISRMSEWVQKYIAELSKIDPTYRLRS
jgi:dTDP-glucose 4,6-dehydratase